MSLAATNRNDYVGAGSLAAYAFTFRITEETDLAVTVRDDDDIETELELSADYTVSAAPWTSGGTITLLAGNLASGYKLTIRRERPFTQGTDLVDGNAYLAETIEAALDNAQMVAQQLDDARQRSLRLGDTDPAFGARIPAVALRAGMFMAFDAAGDPTVSAGSGGGDSSLRSDLAASGGSALLGFLQAGAALNRTVQAKLRESCISVTDFGTAAGGTALATAITAIGSTPTTLLVTETVVVSDNVTVPVNIALVCLAQGQLAPATTKTVTIAGAFRADRTQCFSGAGSIDLTDAKLDWVYPEWWGAVALKAATGTPANSTTAIEAAVNSNRNVLFDQGIYGTTGGHIQSADGQTVIGQGGQHLSGADGQGGTTIKRLSGTTTLYRLGSYLHMTFAGFKLDGNSLGGQLLRVQHIYSNVEDVAFCGVGGTDYAMFLSSCNISTFKRLTFLDGNYGHILSDSANPFLYSTFENLIMGDTATPGSAGYGLYLQNAANITFLNCGHLVDIKLDTNSRSIRFLGMQCESPTAGGSRAWFEADSTVWGVTISGGALHWNAAETRPMFKFTGTRGVTFDDMVLEDLVSVAGRSWIILDGVFLSRFTRCLAYSTNTFNFIECSGTRSDDITVDEVNYHSGAVGSVIWKTARLSLARTNMPSSFLAGATELAIGPMVTGTITRANLAGTVTLDQTSAARTVYGTFASLDATPSVDGWCQWKTANAGATTITDFDDAVDGTEYIIIINDANTTIDFSGTNLKGNAGVDYAAPSGTLLRVRVNGSLKLCEIVKPA